LFSPKSQRVCEEEDEGRKEGKRKGKKVRDMKGVL